MIIYEFLRKMKVTDVLLTSGWNCARMELQRREMMNRINQQAKLLEAIDCINRAEYLMLEAMPDTSHARLFCAVNDNARKALSDALQDVKASYGEGYRERRQAAY